MTREIKNTNEYSAKLVKLIPTEIIAAYIAIEGILSGHAALRKKIFPWICLFLLLLIPFYYWRIFKVRKVLQIIITMMSFAVWIFSMGGPFLMYLWYKQVYGAVLLILWTTTVPLLNFQTNVE